MEFPFQVGVHDQQTQKEKDHIAEFVDGENAPHTEHTYKNKTGKERKVIRVWLPKGCKITNRYSKYGITVFNPRNRNFYHTPLAKIDGVLGRVDFIEDGEYGSCDSKEWIKWCSGGSSKHTPTPDPTPHPNKRGIMKATSEMSGDQVNKKNITDKLSGR